MKAIMKYPGSKWSIADWIIRFFPEHHSYFEPFFGSGAVLFNKPRSNIETVNDLDGNVVNLFKCIREDPERLARAIYMTPYSRQVYEDAFSEVPEEPYEKALNFYIKLNMGHGFRTNGQKVGWKNDVQGRERSYASQDWCNLPEKIMLAAQRLRGVQIENKPAVDLIRRFNFENVLIYCDPPYVISTRHGAQYRCEMNNEDHEQLLEVLKAHKGFVIISGYETEMYDSILSGWNKFSTTSYSQVCSKKKEIIWMNYDPPKKQITLEFDGGGIGMLILPIKKKWFDMILSGEKKEEYREIKPYYEKRFNNILRNNPRAFDSKGTLNEWLITDIKYILAVRFRNGYSSGSPSFVANCRLTIGTGRPEWGAEPGKRYYILTIQDIIKER